MFRRRNSKERKGDETRNSIQSRSSLIPKLRPRPKTTKTEVPNTTSITTTTNKTATSARKSYNITNNNNNNNNNNNKTISGRVTRKSTKISSSSATSITSSRKSVLPIPAKLSLIPSKRPPRQAKAPPKDITNTASSSATKTVVTATTTTNRNTTAAKTSLPGFLRPTASSLAKSRKRPSLTLVKASPTPTKQSIKKARRDKPNPKKMESRKEKREAFRTSTIFEEEDEEDVPLKKNGNHQDSNSDTDSCPTTTADDDDNNPTTDGGGTMDVEDLRRDVTINEESFAQKCLIEIHSTPKTTTDVHSGLSLARRALLRQGKKVHPTTILNDASAKQNAKLNFSFGMDSEEDDDDALIPDCEAYEVFSTPIRNFATSVSSPPNSTSSDNDDDDSIYFTPCGEI